MPPFAMDEARAEIASQFGMPAEVLFEEFRTAGRGRLDRPGAPGTSARSRRAAAPGSGEDPAPRHRAAFCRGPSRLLHGGAPRRAGAQAAEKAQAGGGGGNARALGRHGDGPPDGGGGDVGDGSQWRQGPGLPGARDRLATDLAAGADERVDRRDRAVGPGGAHRSRHRSRALGQPAHRDLPASRPARRLLPRRHASRQSVHRSRRQSGGGRFRDHGSAHAKDRQFLAEILWGFITRDYARIAAVHFDAGYVPHTQDPAVFAQALRAIGEPILDRTAEDISMARLLTQLFEVTAQFDMQTQPQLLLLQKTMVVVEGVARSFNPRLNMWLVATPVVREWMNDALAPERRLAEGGVGSGDDRPAGCRPAGGAGGCPPPRGCSARWRKAAGCVSITRRGGASRRRKRGMGRPGGARWGSGRGGSGSWLSRCWGELGVIGLVEGQPISPDHRRRHRRL